MSLLQMLSDETCWEQFYSYKLSQTGSRTFTKYLRSFIDDRGYIPVCEKIAHHAHFALPKRTVINKQYSGKKRVVYTYPDAENTVLKLLTYLMLRRYDGLFSPNLYSFRPGCTAKDAVHALVRHRGIRQMYAYKVDISNYFNSVDIRRLLPMLEDALSDDPALYRFLAALLTEPDILDGSRIRQEEKGIMAGTPQSSFFANLYLRGLDQSFASRGIPYARYSDDIIVFADSYEGAEQYASEIRSFLHASGLTVNPAKECFSAPEDGFVFLGFACKNGVTDIAPASVSKLMHKMRRKTKALRRWYQRNGLTGENAARAFIKIFNSKMYEQTEANAPEHQLTWSRWYFPVINSTESLHRIDRYAQDCIRYLLTDKRNKARFRADYQTLKSLGYKSLVHCYYTANKAEHQERGEFP